MSRPVVITMFTQVVRPSVRLSFVYIRYGLAEWIIATAHICFFLHYTCFLTALSLLDGAVASKKSLERASPNNIEDTCVQYCHLACPW